MVDKASLYRDFKKSELLAICSELELKASADDTAIKIVDRIVTDIDEKGLPEPSESSKLLREFMLTAEYIDEYGNVIEEGTGAQIIEAQPVQEEAAKVPQLPTCYGLNDERDPACHKCKVARDCHVQRIKNRPECFGKMFDKNAVECQVCIEASACQTEILS